MVLVLHSARFPHLWIELSLRRSLRAQLPHHRQQQQPGYRFQLRCHQSILKKLNKRRRCPREGCAILSLSLSFVRTLSVWGREASHAQNFGLRAKHTKNCFPVDRLPGRFKLLDVFLQHVHSSRVLVNWQDYNRTLLETRTV